VESLVSERKVPMKATFRGVFLTSEHPATTAGFYEQVAGIPLEKVGTEGGYVYWKTDKDGMQIAIHDANLFAAYTHPVCAGSNVTHLYFKIDDQRAFLTHLSSIGLAPYAQDDVVVTIVDPDGRKVMFGVA
jgi:hypothetical protein